MIPPDLFVLPDRLVVVQREPGRSDVRRVSVAGLPEVRLFFLPMREAAPLWGAPAIDARDAGDMAVEVDLLSKVGDGAARAVDPVSYLAGPLRAIRDAVGPEIHGIGAPVPLQVHFHPAVKARAHLPVIEEIRRAGFAPSRTATLAESFVAGARMKGDISEDCRVLVADAGFGSVHLSMVIAGAPVRLEMVRELPGLIAAEHAEERVTALAELVVRRAVRLSQAALTADEVNRFVQRLVPKARAWLQILEKDQIFQEELPLDGFSPTVKVTVRLEELEESLSRARQRLFTELDVALKNLDFDEVRVLSPALWSDALRDRLEQGRRCQVYQSWNDLFDLAAMGGLETAVSEAPMEPAGAEAPSPIVSTRQRIRRSATRDLTRPVGIAVPARAASAIGTVSRGKVHTITHRVVIELASGEMAFFDGRDIRLPSGETCDLSVEDSVEVRVIGRSDDGRATVEILRFLGEVKVRPVVTAPSVRNRYEPVDASEISRIRVLPWHHTRVRGVAVSPDGRWVASGGDDSKVQLRDIVTTARVELGAAHEKAVFGVAWSPASDRFVSVSGDNTARIWRVADGSCLLTLVGHESWVQAVAWSRDGKRIATGGADRAVRLWDAGTGDLLDVVKMGPFRVRSLAFAPDGLRLAIAGQDANIRLVQIATRQNSELSGHATSVTQVVWSPDGHTLASAARDGEIRLWQVGQGASVALHGHRGEVTGLTFSPDGGLLLSAGSDGTLREWTVRKPNEAPSVRSLHLAGLTAVSLSGDAAWGAVGTDDGKVILIKREETERSAAPSTTRTDGSESIKLGVEEVAPIVPPVSSAATESESPNDYTWQTVGPSEAVPAASAAITTFDELMDEIEAFAAIDIPLRHLIKLFGAERRGRKIVSRIREAFEDFGLGYSDAIELANIDSVVRLHGDGTPAQEVIPNLGA